MKFKWKAILLSGALYAVSLVTPAIYIQNFFVGGMSCCWGWQCLFFGGLTFQWLANPVLALAVILLSVSCFRSSFVAGLLTFVIAASTPFYTCLIPFIVDDRPFRVNSKIKVDSSIGFYLWLASIAVIVVASGWCLYQEKKTRQPDAK